jgi:dTDP-4-amino-4,6-dideoxygalactose transaminase
MCAEDRIPLAAPRLDGNEEAYLRECIESTYVSSVGPFVGRMESEVASKVGARYAVACASGTAAIHLALLALGVGTDDDVLVSDLTFIAAANPVVHCGARVVLIDSERDTWNLDPGIVADELRARARSRRRQPGAIVVVHGLGQPADAAPLLEVAQRYGVPVVEDAAEALGAAWVDGPLRGSMTGTVGAVGCYSFNGNKVITTGGGGMVVTDDEGIAARARHLSTQARMPGVAYWHDEVGYNYRLTNLAAAVGVAQLEKLDAFVEAKRAIASRYDAAFEGVLGVTVPPDPVWARRSAWLYTVLFASAERRDAVHRALDAVNIETRPLWTPLHRQKPYMGARVLGGAVADDLASRGLSLPCSVHLSLAQQDRVLDSVLATLVRAA